MKKTTPAPKATAKKQAAAKNNTAKKTVAKSPVKKQAAKSTGEAAFVAHSTSLKAGSKAPAFSARDQHGATISLKDLKGKRVVLYFYPKDNTPTCTLEACSLRDEHAYLAKKNYTVIGVSADDEKMHKKFADKYAQIGRAHV